MPTLNQLLHTPRRRSKRYCRTLNLVGSPQKKGICVRVYTTKPKKPNSAIRKIAKIKFSNGLYVRAAIPGQGHNLQEHSVVMVRGGRVRDIPGIHYKLIRGKYDFLFKENFDRFKRRSKFSIPRPSSSNS